MKFFCNQKKKNSHLNIKTWLFDSENIRMQHACLTARMKSERGQNSMTPALIVIFYGRSGLKNLLILTWGGEINATGMLLQKWEHIQRSPKWWRPILLHQFTNKYKPQVKGSQLRLAGALQGGERKITAQSSDKKMGFAWGCVLSKTKIPVLCVPHTCLQEAGWIYLELTFRNNKKCYLKWYFFTFEPSKRYKTRQHVKCSQVLLYYLSALWNNILKYFTIFNVMQGVQILTAFSERPC